MRIVLEGLRGETSIAELCRREGLHPNLYYKWSKEFIEAGKQRLVGDIHREADSREVNEMRSEIEQLKQLVAELALKNRVLKKLAGQGHAMGGLTTTISNISMRHSQAEKREIIHLVEHSQLPVRKTLEELGIPASTFYRWYRKYEEGDGVDGLIDRSPSPHQFWNRIPETVCKQVVDLALDHPDRSPRQVAWLFTDQQGYFISESSVFRILKHFDLVENPSFRVLSAADKFAHPTKRVNELWQTDFTYFKILNWGWYYLSTVLDDYSRYILAWKLFPTMSANDVQVTLQLALDKTGLDQVLVEHRPRLLSDNGSCYLSKDLKDFLDRKHMEHTRSAPYHPMTQGKIERYHRSVKNIVNLQNYFLPEELEREVASFVEYYNHQRYHESLENLTPADMFYGRAKEVLTRRQEIKLRTLQERRLQNLRAAV